MKNIVLGGLLLSAACGPTSKLTGSLPALQTVEQV